MVSAEAKSPVLSFISPAIVFALVTMVVFWLTIVQPDKINPQETPASKGVQEQLLNSPQVLEEAEKLEPCQLQAAGKTNLALAAAQKMIADKPHDALVCICSGNVIFKNGDKKQALRILKRSVALAPRSRFVRLNLAEKLVLDKNYAEAQSQYKMIIQAYPRWLKPHQQLAEAYLASSRPDLAAQEYALILEQEPNNGDIRQKRGLALASSGQVRQGLAEYMQGQAIEQNFSGFPPDVKEQAQQWGSVERATVELRRQLSAHPEDLPSKLILARILLYTGQLPEAKTLLLEARKKSPLQFEIHRNLAVVLQKLSEPNLALAEFLLSVNLEKTQKKATLP